MRSQSRLRQRCVGGGVHRLTPFDNGQGKAFVGDGVVLKPVLDPRQFDWLALSSYSLPQIDELRITRPRPAGDQDGPSRDGSAWEYLEGEVRDAMTPTVAEARGSRK